MVLSLRERRRQMLRNEILHAARRLVSEKGYLAMSMEELAAQVGISKPTLYSHFATKEDLIVAAAVQVMQRIIDLIESAPDGQTPLQAIVSLLRTALQGIAEEDMIASHLSTPELSQLIHSREETRSRIQQIEASILRLIQQAMQQGEIDTTLDPGAILLVFDAMLHTLKIDCCSKKVVDRAVMINSLITIFERGLRRP